MESNHMEDGNESLNDGLANAEIENLSKNMRVILLSNILIDKNSKHELED